MAGKYNILTRRRLIAGAGIAALGTGVFAAQWFNVGARNSGQTLTPPQAHEAARAGEIILIDIRRPDEWRRTGIGQGAVPLDMRRPDFTQALRGLVTEPDAAIALICARGVRSRKMTARLQEAGFTHILDVPEGMLGSGAGPGWLKRGLPVVPG